MGVMRMIINWCDNTMEQSLTEEKPHKAFASGFVEGFCDAAVVMYVPILICCYIAGKNLDK